MGDEDTGSRRWLASGVARRATRGNSAEVPVRSRAPEYRTFLAAPHISLEPVRSHTHSIYQYCTVCTVF